MGAREIDTKSAAIKAGIVKDHLHLDVPLSAKRAAWEKEASALPLAAGVELERDTIAGVPCLWVRCRHGPIAELIVYVHGGGLVEGSAVTHQEFASRLAVATDMNVLLIDYRLAPEFVYPAARMDVMAVLAGCVEPTFQKGDSRFDRVHVAADSSGAGLLLSALVAMSAAQVRRIAKMVLISGVYDHSFSGDSVRALRDIDPFTSIEVLKHCAALYVGEADVSDPGVSPLFADLSNLPDALVLVGGDEILLSDSRRLHEALRSAGNATRLIVEADMWHVWPLYPALEEAADALATIRTHLESPTERPSGIPSADTRAASAKQDST